MGRDRGAGDDRDEEIQGAPPVVRSEDLRRQRLTETVTLNRFLYRQFQQLDELLLQADDLQSLLQILLQELPRLFSLAGVELWLYDPEHWLAQVLDDRTRQNRNLSLLADVYDLYQFYDPRPGVILIDATDPRMFEILKADYDLNHALLMPLLDGDDLVGSLHWGLRDDAIAAAEADRELISHQGTIVSICFNNAVKRQRLAQLSLLDPFTEIGNRRGFEFDIAREIARAKRETRPLSLLLLAIDDYADLQQYHGHTTCEYVLKKVAERVASGLRSTDRLARLSADRLAVLLPASGTVMAEEVAERMRTDVETFPVDDGRGAVMHATMSIGLVTWEPKRYPAMDLRQLARQLESAAAGGLARAQANNGNRVAVSRLGALIV